MLVLGNSSITKDLADWWNYSMPYDVEIDKLVEKKDNKLIMKLALPGVNKEDLELKYEKDILTISHKEISDFIDQFSYSYILNDYDFKTLKNSLVNGVLTLELSKKDEAKPVIVKLE